MRIITSILNKQRHLSSTRAPNLSKYRSHKKNDVRGDEISSCFRTLSTVHSSPFSRKLQMGDDAHSRSEFNSDEKEISEVSISEVLKQKHTVRWVEPVIRREATVSEAIEVCIDRGLSGMMVIDQNQATYDLSRERGKVVGMTTSRDLLRMVAAGVKQGLTADDVLTQTVGNFMTPISQVIYARPDETIRMVRNLMTKLGMKTIPILSAGRVEGLITSRDMAEFGLDAKALGGKKNYLRNISQRRGLGKNTSMAEPPNYLRDELSLQQNPLYISMAMAELPHPFKTAEGCGSDLRDFGPKDLSTNNDLCEDAHFSIRVAYPDGLDMTYMGVADGVGSWREHGVDPRAFSHKLMEECHNIVVESSSKAKQTLSDERRCGVMTPQQILSDAYERVKDENIIGSSTACVAMFDSVRHQLYFSNLGDSGIIVLRHIDTDVAGVLGSKSPSSEPKLRAAYVSQQQLLSFNHPYQFGWTGEELKHNESSFKSAADTCDSSMHIRRGDIVVMATDGLFDNVEIDEIAQIALEWEEKNKFIEGGVKAREKRWQRGISYMNVSEREIPQLAHQLCKRARENSLDKTVDSPFSTLAKENDIMWSGGMPDDCTVIVMHIGVQKIEKC